MEISLPTVLLRPGTADRVIAGHPWIYAGSVLRLTAPAADGALVQIKDHRQRFLGVGFYNSKSKIQVRVLAPERVEVNSGFFTERIRAALAERQRHLPRATSFRVVNAESDFLSGLIVDKYGDVLVAQISSLGMDQRKAMIVEALQGIFSPRAIVERSEASFRKFEGLAESNGLLSGAVEGPVQIDLNGLKFDVDILGGHKTGLYLDQQQNYQKVADLIRGGQVLDCFSFLGGFALHCARAGAAHVHGLEQSEEGQWFGRPMLLRNGQRLRLAQSADRRPPARKGHSEIRRHYT
jgi:23S rRNA (cytosine1962-C5)-methyltransferase